MLSILFTAIRSKIHHAPQKKQKQTKNTKILTSATFLQPQSLPNQDTSSPKLEHIFQRFSTASCLANFFFLRFLLDSQNKNFSGNFHLRPSVVQWRTNEQGKRTKTMHPTKDESPWMAMLRKTGLQTNKKHTKQKTNKTARCENTSKNCNHQAWGFVTRATGTEETDSANITMAEAGEFTHQTSTNNNKNTKCDVAQKQKQNENTNQNCWQSRNWWTSSENKPNTQQQNNELTEIQEVRDQQNNLRNNFTATTNNKPNIARPKRGIVIIDNIPPNWSISDLSSSLEAVARDKRINLPEPVSASRMAKREIQNHTSNGVWRWGLDHKPQWQNRI